MPANSDQSQNILADSSQQQSNPDDRLRCRIRFQKFDTLRYTSHLDLAAIWERTFRRAGVRLVYSQGFNPRPKIHLAAALPLGYASTCELLDAWVESHLPDLPGLKDRLNHFAPSGLRVDSISLIDLRSPALQTLTHSAEYMIIVRESVDRSALQNQIDQLLAESTLMVQKGKRRVDFRPLIFSVEVEASLAGELSIHCELAVSQQLGTGRPDLLLSLLDLDPLSADITRTVLKLSDSPSDV
jgi:radical SAM-linked protein